MKPRKYMFSFYKKFAFFFLFGIIALILVDWIQIQLSSEINEIVVTFEKSINTGWTDELKEATYRIVGRILLIGAGMLVGRVLWRISIFHASHKIESLIRRDMFIKAEKLSISYYHENKVGTVMAWFTNDLETIEEYLGWGTIMFIDAIFLTIFASTKMVLSQWQLTIIVFIPLLLIVIWGFLVEKFSSLRWEERQKSFDDLYDFAQENFTGIRVIKAFVKENQQLFAFRKVAKKSQIANFKMGHLATIFEIIITLIIASIAVIILGLGGFLIFSTIQGNPIVLFGSKVEMTTGDLAEFLYLFDALIWPLIAMGQIISMHSRYRTSLGRVVHYLNAEEDIKDRENAVELDNPQGKITFKNFSFSYPDDKTNRNSLKNVSLEIKAGEKIGIVGKIGCGKSTFVNILLHLYNIEKGTVFIDDIDLMDIKVSSLRNAIAYVPQDVFLFGDTINRNIAFYDINKPTEEIVKAAQFAVIDNDINNFKDKYETYTGERGVTLSGGQKQRISIARAYLKDAPILILDDSVSAVDIKTEEEILKHIKSSSRSQTTLVVASRVSTVNKLDRILVLKDGEVEAFASHDELLKISPTYKKMVALQEIEREIQEGGIKDGTK